MSLSNPRPTNPVTKFIQFKGDEGVWQFYQKGEDGNGRNIEIETPFYFVVLDELSTIKGFSEPLSSGLYSNEVHNVAREKLTVRSFKGNWEMIGFYSEIKDKVKNQGGKFTKSVYAMLLDKNGNHEMVNFQIKGAAFSAWFDLKFNQEKHLICVTKILKDETKGSIKYKVPVFTVHPMKEETLKRAIAMDEQLQKFFQARKQHQIDEQEVETVKANPVPDDDWESAPTHDMVENFEGEEIPTPSDSDLPF